MKSTSIKETIQGLQLRDMEMLEGTVTSVSPVMVKADNDNQILNNNVLTVPERFRSWGGGCSLSGGTVSGQTSDGSSITKFSLTGAAVSMQTPLQIGDKVMLIAYNGKKKYYILDRV